MKAFLFALPLLVTACLGRVTQYSVEFCTFDDEVYQAVTQNIDAWLERVPSEQEWVSARENFPATPMPMGDVWIYFTVPSGKRYVANAEYIVIEQRHPAMIFVSLGQDYPHSILGTHGYIYTLEDPLPHFSPTYLQLTPLAANIYCYRDISSG